MKTVSIGVENLCVPCNDACKYCLLSSCGKSTGVDYDRSQVFAERFYKWIRMNRKDLNFQFYVGYCMDFPQLFDFIDFAKSTGSVGGEFLQMNGMQLRGEAETTALFKNIAAHGVKRIDLTFYGLKEYHDKFAGRKGDFDYLFLMWQKAVEAGIQVEISVPVTRENSADLPDLLEMLQILPSSHIVFFLPHAKGRGASLEKYRITADEFSVLPRIIKDRFQKTEIKTESDWIREGNFKTAEKRSLILSLTPGNIGDLENTDFDKIIAELEQLDNEYYKVVPGIEELARRYGDGENRQLFRIRDLYLKWQKDFISENCREIYDMNDERHSFSVRF